MQIKLLSSLLILVLASGCSDLAKRPDHSFGDPGENVANLVKSVGHTAPGVVQMAAPTVVHDKGIWLGKKVVKVGPPPLPAIFLEPTSFDRTVYSLSELAERITLRSGIPTKVSPDALAVASGMAPPAPAAAAAGGVPGLPPVAGSAVPSLPMGKSAGSGPAAGKNPGPVHINYSNGNFQNFLDTAAARYGVYWKYANGAIQFYHTDSRAFQISAIPGDSTFTASVNSGADSSGGTDGGGKGVSAANNQNTGVSSQLSIYSNIEKSINAMLSAYGKTVASPATGTISVVDTPDVLERVAAFVENENLAMSRQIAINVTVLSVTLNDSDEYGINWNLVYGNLLSKYGIQNTLSASPDSVALSAGVLDTSKSKFAGTKLVIQALAEQGKVRRQTTASVVTLNNQPVPVQVARQTSYLKSSTSTTTALAGTSTTLTPGVVTSGFNMSVLPHILNNGTVMMQFSADISALRQMRVVLSGGSKIETPELDTRNFLQRVAMKSNETLIISGFEQNEDDLDRKGVGEASNYALGGGVKRSTGKEVIVILITPTSMASS
ncbi:type IVB pilus formation R64 PilN family outer membrane protein [Oxalobacteraceae bacterium GrIS 1.11]